MAVTIHGLEFKLGSEVSVSDYPFLAAMLNDFWQLQIHATPYMMKTRFNSGNLFIVASAEANEDDVKYYERLRRKERFPIPIELGMQIPIGIVETLALYKEGDSREEMFMNIRDYDTETDEGHWKPPEKDANMLLFVDLTVISARNSHNSRTDHIALTDYILNFAAMHIDYEAYGTMTPNLPRYIRFHEKKGNARNSHIFLPNARQRIILSDTMSPDSMVMDYTDEVIRRRMEYLRDHF